MMSLGYEGNSSTSLPPFTFVGEECLFSSVSRACLRLFLSGWMYLSLFLSTSLSLYLSSSPVARISVCVYVSVFVSLHLYLSSSLFLFCLHLSSCLCLLTAARESLSCEACRRRAVTVDLPVDFNLLLSPHFHSPPFLSVFLSFLSAAWYTMRYLVYGLGFYSAVLGWRVYGGGGGAPPTPSNFITLRTCTHMNVLSFGADL